MGYLKSGIGDGKDLFVNRPTSAEDLLLLTLKVKFFFDEQATDFYELDIALQPEESLDITVRLEGDNVITEYRDENFDFKRLEVPIPFGTNLTAIEVDDQDPFVSTTIGGRTFWERPVVGGVYLNTLPSISVSRRLYVKKADSVIWKWNPKVHVGHYYFGPEEFYLFSDMISESLSSPVVSGSTYHYVLQEKPVAGSPIMIGSLTSTLDLKRVQAEDEIIDEVPVPYILVPDQPLGKATFIIPANVAYESLNVFYEGDPSGYFVAEEVELNPLLNTSSRGFIYLSKSTQIPYRLHMISSKRFLTLREESFFTVKVVDVFGNPIVNEQVEIVITPVEEGSNLYVFDGVNYLLVGPGGEAIVNTDQNGIVVIKYLYYSLGPSSVTIKARIYNLTEDANTSETEILSLNQSGFSYPPLRLILMEGERSGETIEIIASLVDQYGKSRPGAAIDFFHDKGIWQRKDGSFFNDVTKPLDGDLSKVFRAAHTIVTAPEGNSIYLAKAKHVGFGETVIRARTVYNIPIVQRPSFFAPDVTPYIWAHPLVIS